MRWLLLVALSVVPAFAQNNFNNMWSFTTKLPTGHCNQGQAWVKMPTGDLYTCVNGTPTQYGGGSGTGITSLNAQTGSIQTFGNDTNVTITSSANNHQLGWTGTLAAARMVNAGVFTGDATSTFPALTIGAGAITLAKMANLAANSIIGNNTGSGATPIALTAAQVATMLSGQSLFTLTTTGTSGAATYSGGTLNIPQYTGGGTTIPSVTNIIKGNGSGNGADTKVAITSPTTAATLIFSVDNASITLQGTDTYIGRATTDSLTNKTYDTAGAGNSFKINGTAITAVSGTGAVCLASGSACSGGASALSAITNAAGSNTLSNGNNPQVWNWAQTTASQVAFTFGETTAATSTGTPYNVQIKTATGSTAIPLNVLNSLNGSQTLPALAITPTWNTTGVVDAALLVNPTNTASGTGSLLADFQLGGTSQWKVDKAGNVTSVGGWTSGSGGSVAGYTAFGQGTATTAPTASVGFQAPTSVTTKFMMTLPAAPITGFLLNTGTTDPSVISFIPPQGTDTKVMTAGAVSGTSALLCTDANGGATTSSCPTASAALSSITAATGANTIASGNNAAQIWNWAQTANTQTAFTIGETTAATSGTLGNQYGFKAVTLAGSTAVPMNVTSSLTGSQTLPTLHITPTWNTSGVVDAALLVNVTNTASGAASKLIDAQTGGTSEFSVDKSGVGSFTSSVGTGTQPACTAGTAGGICFTEGSALTNVASTGALDANLTTHELEYQSNGSALKGMIVRAQPGSVRSTALVASVSTATLCAASAGACNTAGEYHLHLAMYQSGTACTANTTAGVSFQLTWTDGNGTAHSAQTIPLDTNASLIALSGTMAWAQTTLGAYASGDFNIDTNGTIIQYATTFAQCTSGTATYALSAAITRVQ